MKPSRPATPAAPGGPAGPTSNASTWLMFAVFAFDVPRKKFCKPFGAVSAPYAIPTRERISIAKKRVIFFIVRPPILVREYH